MKPGIEADRPESSGPDYVWIDAPDTLQRMIRRLEGAGRIAIDVEGDSLYHYFEKVCLIQISTDQETFIIDPLALPSLDGLGRILSDCTKEKVLHAAAYDVSSLRRDYQFLFCNIFDTHVSAELLGFEQRGLDDLLQEFLGVRHSKRRQRDDWSRRPLDPEQLRYAAMDTHHLLALRDLLAERLEAKGRTAWAEEEFLHTSQSAPLERKLDPDGFLRIKGSRDLSSSQLSVLRSLYLLRDRYARMMDLPPFKVLNNSVLVDLAQRPPATPRELFRRPGVSYRMARNFAGEIHRTMVKAASEKYSPRPPGPRPPGRQASRKAKERLGLLKQWRASVAERLALPVGVVFPSAQLEQIAAAPPAGVSELEAIEGMRRWRLKEFGPEILRLIRSGRSA